MSIVKLDELPREKRIEWASLAVRVISAAIRWDHVTSTPQKDNRELRSAHQELHEAVKAWNASDHSGSEGSDG